MHRLNDWYLRLQGLRPWLYNRYVWVGAFVLVWMLLFDRYDLATRLRMQQRIAQLTADRAHYRREITRLKLERNLLQTNLLEVERIAREQYLMKRAHEDLYVVVPVPED